MQNLGKYGSLKRKLANFIAQTFNILELPRIILEFGAEPSSVAKCRLGPVVVPCQFEKKLPNLKFGGIRKFEAQTRKLH